MKQFIIDLFKLEKKPVKGLMAYEWVVMGLLGVDTHRHLLYVHHY